MTSFECRPIPIEYWLPSHSMGPARVRDIVSRPIWGRQGHWSSPRSVGVTYLAATRRPLFADATRRRQPGAGWSRRARVTVDNGGVGSPGPPGSPTCPVFEGLLPAPACWCRAPRFYLHRLWPPPVGLPGQSSSGSPSSESSPARPPRPVVVGLPCLPPPARWRRAPRSSGSPARPPGPSSSGSPAQPPCPVFVKRE